MDYSTITELDLSNKGLIKLPDLSLYTNLKKLNCHGNKIATLDNLPPTIITLYCHGNKIATLDNLPLTLIYLLCSNNSLQYYFKPTLGNIRKHNIKNRKSRKSS